MEIWKSVLPLLTRIFKPSDNHEEQTLFPYVSKLHVEVGQGLIDAENTYL